MGLSKTLLASLISSMGVFSPKYLFEGAIQGAWYDANDLSTLWQDVSGTIPAVVNAKVARVSDRSGNGNHVIQATAGAQAYLRGTPKGANLVADSFFYSGASWSSGAGWTISSPSAVGVSASGSLGYALPAEVGKWYLVKFTLQARTAGSVTVSFGGTTIAAASVSGTYQKCIYATTSAAMNCLGSGFSGIFRGLEVYDISSSSVGSPYYLDFDGVATFYSCPSMISSYPATFIADHVSFPGVTLPTLFCLYQSDVDRKSLDINGSVDVKESNVSAYNSNTYLSTRAGAISELANGSNISEGNLLAGSASAHGNTWGSKTSFLLGKGYSTAFFENGQFFGGVVIAKQLSAQEKALVRSHYSMGSAIQAWGDSMTAGSGTGVTTGWPVRLQDSIKMVVENKGAGGETSAQITTRFVADTSNKDQWINTFWMGTNDGYIGDQPAWVSGVLANIATCVSGLKGSKRYLVLGVTRYDGGAVPKSALDTLDSQLISIYAEKFVDVRGYLQSRNDGSVNDLADISAGLVPRSLRSDFVHLSDKGYQMVSDLLSEKIKALGWAQI